MEGYRVVVVGFNTKLVLERTVVIGGGVTATAEQKAASQPEKG